jgi:hypothetical protein
MLDFISEPLCPPQMSGQVRPPADSLVHGVLLWPGICLLILLVLSAHPGEACTHRRHALRQRHGARTDTADGLGRRRQLEDVATFGPSISRSTAM